MTEQRYETGTSGPDDDRTRELRSVDVLAEAPGGGSGSAPVAAGPAEGTGFASPVDAGTPSGTGVPSGDVPPPGAASTDGQDLTSAAAALTGAPRSTPRARRPVGAAATARTRRARLHLRRVDPLSVFLLALLLSLFLAIVIVVAVVALYAVLAAAGVPSTINDLFAEITRASGDAAAQPEPLLTARRAVLAAGVIAAVDVVLLTALATLGALLYNLCASFTGGLTITLAEPEER